MFAHGVLRIWATREIAACPELRYPHRMLTGRRPAAPLSDQVAMIWYAENWKPVESRQRHMPDGSSQLIISLGSAASELSIFTGPRSESGFIDTSEPLTLVGAWFKKGGAAPFLRLPASELHNIDAPLADVCGRGAASLRERLLETQGPERRMTVLEQWLASRLRAARQPEPAVLWAVRQFERMPAVRVSDVAGRIGRSSRWFIERFAGNVGLTPKVFSRIQRFHLALRHAHTHPDVSLAQLAAAAGYFDQAHFNHDFRSIAGITPSEYLTCRTEHLNHVAVR